MDSKLPNLHRPQKIGERRKYTFDFVMNFSFSPKSVSQSSEPTPQHTEPPSSFSKINSVFPLEFLLEAYSSLLAISNVPPKLFGAVDPATRTEVPYRSSPETFSPEIKIIQKQNKFIKQ